MVSEQFIAIKNAFLKAKISCFRKKGGKETSLHAIL